VTSQEIKFIFTARIFPLMMNRILLCVNICFYVIKNRSIELYYGRQITLKATGPLPMTFDALKSTTSPEVFILKTLLIWIFYGAKVK
jgi:hypothetical protein